jgi:parallel beta-helix repeat protein
MKKAIALLLIVFFFILSLFPILNSTQTEETNTIYVDDDNTNGPWDGTIEHPYQYIQDGIDNASDGDTIWVLDGVYKGNIVVNRTLSIAGNGFCCTVIDGMGRRDDVVSIIADGVELKGFTIRNSSKVGVHLFSSYNIIQDNEIINNSQGLILSSSHDNIISGNNISNNSGDGLYLKYSNNNDIIGNSINYNIAYGIELWISSYNCIADNNISYNNPMGYYYGGISLFDHSNSNNISRNNFIKNKVSQAGFSNSFFNHWNNNYWDDWSGIGPKIIWGIFPRKLIFIPWINFDWHPASEPYDIPT